MVVCDKIASRNECTKHVRQLYKRYYHVSVIYKPAEYFTISIYAEQRAQSIDMLHVPSPFCKELSSI